MFVLSSMKTFFVLLLVVVVVVVAVVIVVVVVIIIVVVVVVIVVVVVVVVAVIIVVVIIIVDVVVVVVIVVVVLITFVQNFCSKKKTRTKRVLGIDAFAPACATLIGSVIIKNYRYFLPQCGATKSYLIFRVFLPTSSKQ